MQPLNLSGSATTAPGSAEELFDIRRIKTRGNAPQIKPLTIVSSDSHATLPPRDFVDYMDPKYREEAAEYCTFMEERWYRLFDYSGYPYPSEVLDVIDDRGAIRSGGELGTFDPARRLRECEADGVVAEIIHPDGPLGSAPFFSSFQRKSTPELRAAGARAHNRFISDFCSVDPRRLLGVHLVYPWPDMNAALADCAAASEAGARGIFPPQQAGVEGDPDPAFSDRRWDPLWAACEEFGLAIDIHAGWGAEQGIVDRIIDVAISTPDAVESLIVRALETFDERRPLWQLMWGGVFDRFPGLRVVFSEIHCDWVPGTLAFLDQKAAENPAGMQLKPSEYWERHCAVGATLMRYSDVASRDAVGVEKIMFGTDYPHIEGAWPNSRDWIRATLGDVGEQDARRILGDNAIDFYGLDGEYLEAAALRCGPLPDTLLGDHPVDPRMLAHFELRGGIGKQPDLHEDELVTVFAHDVETASRR